MLPKKSRLPIAKNRRVPQKTLLSPHFSLKVFPGAENCNRFGIVISTNAVKKAVDRHFWKRQYAAHFSRWPNMQKDFLLIASPKMDDTDKKAVKSELDNMLKKLIMNN